MKTPQKITFFSTVVHQKFVSSENVIFQKVAESLKTTICLNLFHWNCIVSHQTYWYRSYGKEKSLSGQEYFKIEFSRGFFSVKKCRKVWKQQLILSFSLKLYRFALNFNILQVQELRERKSGLKHFTIQSNWDFFSVKKWPKLQKQQFSWISFRWNCIVSHQT